jgi:hypothetical protein
MTPYFLVEFLRTIAWFEFYFNFNVLYGTITTVISSLSALFDIFVVIFREVSGDKLRYFRP